MTNKKYTMCLPPNSAGNWTTVVDWLNENPSIEWALVDAYKRHEFNKDECVILKKGSMARVHLGPKQGPRVRASYRTLMYLVHSQKVALVHSNCGEKNCVNPLHQKEVGEYATEVLDLQSKLALAS